MHFRSKLLIVIGMIIIVSVVLSAFITYIFAKKQLEIAAKKEMEQTVALIAKQSEIAIDTMKTDMELLAELPIMEKIARSPGNKSMINEANRYFKEFVIKNKVYQSVNLLDTTAMCIASSYPDRVGFITMQKFVQIKDDFKTAVKGKSNVSQILLSMGTGRPFIAVSVPVKRNGVVLAVIRSILDLDALNSYFLKPQEFIYGGKVFFYDPMLDTTLPEGWKIPNVIKAKPYVKPDIPELPELLTRQQGFIKYSSKNELKLGAFYKTSAPEFLFVVEHPVKEVFAPIDTMARVISIILVSVLFTISAAVFLIANPFLYRLQQCMAFAREIGSGFFNKRLETRGNDEIAQLGHGLNSMVENLEANRASLEKAERMYRGIFENAVEGIFITDDKGFLLNANSSLALILGFDSPADIIGTNVTKYYLPGRRAKLIELLKAGDIAKNFEISFLRQDGVTRIGCIYARADKDENGTILQIQGILEDVTEQRMMEEERRKAEEAELRYTRSQLEALRYQINPHFLFNVLNSIDALSGSDPGLIPNVIGRLSRYMRSTFSPGDSGFVSLEEELETLKSYLDIEKIRFEDNLDVVFDIPPQILDSKIPELFLQPIVENAIKHGMKTTSLPLRIAIQGQIENDLLKIEIANTGKWISKKNTVENRTGVGLENLRKRLELLYTNRYHLNIKEKDGWVHITIEIPQTGTGNDIIIAQVPVTKSNVLLNPVARNAQQDN